MLTARDIDRYFQTSNETRNRTEHDCAIAGLFLFLDIMTAVIYCRIYFPVELLFTYIDNARFPLHDQRIAFILLHQPRSNFSRVKDRLDNFAKEKF